MKLNTKFYFGLFFLVLCSCVFATRPNAKTVPHETKWFANSGNAANPTWLTQRITADDGVVYDEFGSGVSLDGTTALVGAWCATSSGSCPSFSAGPGVAYLFTQNNGVWTQTSKLTANDGSSGDGFGFAVAIDGNTAIVGAYCATFSATGCGKGAAYVFTNSGGIWTQTEKLTANDGTQGDNFGYSVAISGNTIVIGAPHADVNGNVLQGAAYVFTNTGNSYVQAGKLSANDGVSNSLFGESISISGSSILVGTPYDTVNGNLDQGSAYVFTNSGGGWIQTSKLTAIDGSDGDFFGNSVALDSDTALIGASNAEESGNPFQGAAYIFTKSGSEWTQSDKLVANDGATSDAFGASVALSGTSALIGANGATVNNNPAQGKAYTFDDSNGTWVQAAEFIGPNDSPLANFGNSVAIKGNTTLIGALQASINSQTYIGAAYFYGRTNLGFAINAPALVTPGADYLSQTIVTNSATAISPAVIMTIGIPASASLVSVEASQGNCTHTSSAVNCNFGAIPGNAGTATANVTFKATSNSGATIYNSASVSNALPPLTASSVTLVTNDNPPVANNGTLTVKESSSGSASLSATDADGNPLTYMIVGNPSHGTVTLNDANTGGYTYRPSQGYVGADSFTFKANDGQLDSNVATISITVNASSGGGGSGGGGGAVGWLSLLALLGAIVLVRERRRRHYRRT